MQALNLSNSFLFSQSFHTFVYNLKAIHNKDYSVVKTSGKPLRLKVGGFFIVIINDEHTGLETLTQKSLKKQGSFLCFSFLIKSP